jgi:hypothetical protein
MGNSGDDGVTERERIARLEAAMSTWGQLLKESAMISAICGMRLTKMFGK